MNKFSLIMRSVFLTCCVLALQTYAGFPPSLLDREKLRFLADLAMIQSKNENSSEQLYEEFSDVKRNLQPMLELINKIQAKKKLEIFPPLNCKEINLSEMHHRINNDSVLNKMLEKLDEILNAVMATEELSYLENNEQKTKLIKRTVFEKLYDFFERDDAANHSFKKDLEELIHLMSFQADKTQMMKRSVDKLVDDSSNTNQEILYIMQRLKIEILGIVKDLLKTLKKQNELLEDIKVDLICFSALTSD